ncbi:hypothetical protein AABC73_20690 [Pseudomonas sp. G.S.17]|uniref:hypothetical protein n=1 Tax=Pseudomonas sp. G.S.17 TaxID=3137451 RepID=UPI00311CA7F8
MPVINRVTLVLRAPEGETLEQVLPFVQLGAHVSVGRGIAVICGASDSDVVTQALDSEFCIDDHVRMAADAKRYRWLRNKERAEEIDTDLSVTCELQCYFGSELDTEVDNRMRLAQLLEKHGEPV